MGLGITNLITADFRLPEIRTSRGEMKHGAVVPMPEATVDEDNGPVLWEHQVRTPRKAAILQPVAQATCMQSATHHHFGFGIPAADTAHIALTLLRSVDVRHHRAVCVASATRVCKVPRNSSVLIPGRSVTAPNRNLSRYCG